MLPERLKFLTLIILMSVRIQLCLAGAYLGGHGIEYLSGVAVDIAAGGRLTVCDSTPFEVSGVRVSQFQVDEYAVNGRKDFDFDFPEDRCCFVE